MKHFAQYSYAMVFPRVCKKKQNKAEHNKIVIFWEYIAAYKKKVKDD